MRVEFLSGNEAVAKAALDSGLKFYAGYPITPSSEIMHYLARELPKNGGMFIQSEDELAAINMVVGAALAGVKSMTATSGPGFSLMQEGLGYAVMVEAPIVIVNVMRAGPGTGQATKAAQGDVMQARWGRHGDQVVVVLAPSSPQEAYDLTVKAFEIAWGLRVPVVVLSDEFVGHGREVVEMPDKVKEPEPGWGPEDYSKPPFGSDDPRKPPPLPPLGEGYDLLITGSTHDEWGYRDVHSFETHFKLVKRLKEKVLGNIEKVFMYEYFGDDEADILIVAYGSMSRPARTAVRRLRATGFSAGLLKLKTLWPMNYDVLRSYVKDARVVIVPELNLGQVVYDVRIVAGNDTVVVPINKVGGGVPIYACEIVEKAQKVWGEVLEEALQP